MAFYTGSAASAQELLLVLQNKCIAHGWVLTNGILSKKGCFIKAYVNDSTVALTGGTGQNGEELVNQAAAGPKLKIVTSLSGHQKPIIFPLVYNLHIFDNEVYVFVNYNVSYWSYLAFGQSPAGNIPGTGNWFSGTGYGSRIASQYVSNVPNRSIWAMLFPYTYTTLQPNNSIHHQLEDLEWSGSAERVGAINSTTWDNGPSRASAVDTIYPLLSRQPNAWNNEAILLPITPIIFRASSRVTVVASLKHAFYTRNTYYTDGQIITIGNDKYRIYPWLMKDITDPEVNTTSYKDKSGTYAAAIRYDGD